MSRWSAFAALALPDYVKAKFADAFDVTFNESGAQLSKEELLKGAQGKQIVIISVADKLRSAAIEQLPASVKAIACYSVGFDHVNLEAAKARGIAVFHTPDVLTNTVAEATILLMFAAARRAGEGFTQLRNGQWKGWTATELNGIELTGKTLGIFGMGRIGRAIAQRARGLEMKIAYCDRYRLPPEDEQGAAYFTDPEELMKVSNVFVLATASTSETKGFLNARRIGMLPPNPIVVNIARGDLVVDEDLIQALKSKRIFAAGLDVFNNEPLIDTRYRTLPNAFILPHLGSSTIEARLGMTQILIDGLQALGAGKSTRNRLV